MSDPQVITLGGGCFWCLEAVYENVDGVLAVESGYSNGDPALPAPSYEQVCTGRTGHVEVVRVAFDAGRIPLEDILIIFFAIHDPTSLNRQGHDVGTQYRSGIYWTTDAQRAVAERVRALADAQLDGQVVTEIEPLRDYTRAEDYHQGYFRQHPGQGYCAHVIAPKLSAFRAKFRERLKR